MRQRVRALRDGVAGLGDSLDTAARHYETTDESVGTAFQSPFDNGGLLSPTSPTSPFGG